MTNGQTRQAKFALKGGAQFDLEEVKRALTPRYADGVTVLTPPAEK